MDGPWFFKVRDEWPPASLEVFVTGYIRARLDSRRRSKNQYPPWPLARAVG